MMNNRYIQPTTGLACLFALLLCFLPLSVLAHGPMMGQDMGDDADYEMMPGYGMGYGHGMGMGMMGRGPGMMGGMGYGMQMLDLSDAQREKIGQIQQRMRKQQYERMEKMIEAREAMRAEMWKDQPDPEAVARAHDRVSALRREMLKERVQAHNEMRAVLTDEQRERLRETRGMMW